MKFRKKPIVIEATQWFKNGDHPLDHRELTDPDVDPDKIVCSEGRIVRYYNPFNVALEGICGHCSFPLVRHGWIDTFEGGHIVCPGDWIITGVKGEYYPCKPDIFAQTYERVVE